MPKYEMHVSIAPQLHEGEMAYYWHITMTDNLGTFTVKHGWHRKFNFAVREAECASHQFLKR